MSKVAAKKKAVKTGTVQKFKNNVNKKQKWTLRQGCCKMS